MMNEAELRGLEEEYLKALEKGSLAALDKRPFDFVRRPWARTVLELIAEVRRLQGRLDTAAKLFCMDDWHWPDDGSLDDPDGE